MMITKTSKTAKISLTDNSLTEKMKDVFIALIGCDTAQAGPTRSIEWGRAVSYTHLTLPTNREV